MTDNKDLGSTEIIAMVNDTLDMLLAKWQRDGATDELEELFKYSRFIYLFGLECVVNGYMKGLNINKEIEK